MREYICDQCSLPYRTYHAWRKKYKHGFCSRECKYEWNKTVVGYWKGKKMPDTARAKMSANHAACSGPKNGRWRGGRRIDKDGYVLLHRPNHPNCDSDGYIREHRLVMEKSIGRLLSRDEVVHHIDGNKSNNNLTNLQLMTCAEHMSHHSKERRAKKRETLCFA